MNLTYIAIYINNKYSLKLNAIKINNKILPMITCYAIKKYNIILSIVNFFQVKNYKQVIDVIELSKIYGIDHVIIHVTSSTVFIKSILFDYMKSNYVELTAFCFNKEMEHVHSHGQVSKINEILYKYMYNTKYIIFHDIDEIIIPIKYKKYLSLIKNVDKFNSDMYVFKSKLFPYSTTEYKSIANYQRCCIITWGYEKYIVQNLYKYSILDVHKATETLEPIKIKLINSSLGYVRHTRFKGKMCKTNLQDNSLGSIQKYLSQFYIKFEKKYRINY